jgi:replicative DNA helicase
MTNRPVNEQAEKVVLASTFIKNDIVGDCIAAGITEDCFTTQLHKDVWNAVHHQFLNGQEYDELVISNEIRKRYLPEDVNLYQDINALSMAVQTTVSTPIYISECVDTRNLRKAHHVALSTLDDIEKGTSYQEIHKNITDTLAETDTGAAQDISIREVAKKVIDETRERNSKRIKHIGLSTGFGLVDHILGGLRPESNNILAGRPGGGKTTLALQIALNNLFQGIPVRIHSLEMSPEQLIAKMVANRSGVDMNRARDGFLTEEDFQKMEQARAWLTDKPLFIAHTHTTTVDKIAAQHRRDIAKHGNTLCIIDYLQLIKSLNRQASREQQVAEMSRDLKCLFKDTQTQGITLSQMNRNTDETAEPKLSDLRESGSIEQDADTVMFIYKHTDPTKRNLKVAKNRHGQEGKAELTFNGATSTLQ